MASPARSGVFRERAYGYHRDFSIPIFLLDDTPFSKCCRRSIDGRCDPDKIHSHHLVAVGTPKSELEVCSFAGCFLSDDDWVVLHPGPGDVERNLLFLSEVVVQRFFIRHLVQIAGRSGTCPAFWRCYGFCERSLLFHEALFHFSILYNHLRDPLDFFSSRSSLVCLLDDSVSRVS